MSVQPTGPLEYADPHSTPQNSRYETLFFAAYCYSALGLSIFSLFIYGYQFDQRFFAESVDHILYRTVVPTALLAWTIWSAALLRRCLTKRLRFRWLVFFIFPALSSALMLNSLQAYLSAHGITFAALTWINQIVRQLLH